MGSGADQLVRQQVPCTRDPRESLRDLGCSPGEAGFGVDNDCDGFLDEDC